MTNTVVHIDESPEPEPSHDETSAAQDHAEEIVIDASIVAGTSAILAENSAVAAEENSLAAAMAADNAVATAEYVHQENQDLAGIAESLRQTAETLAAIQVAQSAQTSATLAEPENDDSSVDVEPTNDHFLTKRWNFFGRKKNDE